MGRYFLSLFYESLHLSCHAAEVFDSGSSTVWSDSQWKLLLDLHLSAHMETLIEYGIVLEVGIVQLVLYRGFQVVGPWCFVLNVISIKTDFLLSQVWLSEPISMDLWTQRQGAEGSQVFSQSELP